MAPEFPTNSFIRSESLVFRDITRIRKKTPISKKSRTLILPNNNAEKLFN